MRISSAPWKNKTKNVQPQRETLRSKVLASMNGRFCSLDVVCRVFESSFFLCPKMQFWGILDKQSDWLALGKQNVCTNISVWSHWVAKLADKSEHSENRKACWKKKLSGETKIGNTSANIDGFGWGSYACTHSELVQVRLKTTRLITNRLNKDISIQSMLRDWPPNNWDNIRTQWPNLVRLPILLSNRDFNLPSSILSSCLKS